MARRTLRRLPPVVLLLSLGAGCSGSRSAGPETGFVQAKVVESVAELIGGPRAEGRVGDFLLANDRIRVIVGAPGNAPAFNLYGGSILDADVVRPAGLPGFDLFGEALPTVNVTTLTSDPVVTVVRPGCAAPDAAQPCKVARATVSVKGTGVQFPLLPPIPGLTNPVEVDLETLYTLEAGASSLLVETRVTLRETGKTTLQGFDVLLFGSGLDPFGSPGGVDTTGRFDWFGADASRVLDDGTRQRVAYGWLPVKPEPSMEILFEDAAQQLAVMATLEISPGATRTFSRRLVVGEDGGALVTEIQRVRGGSTGTFSGTVTDATGVAVPDALVTLVEKDVDEDGNGEDDAIARLRTDGAGAFSVRLPPGTYVATAAGAGGAGEPIELEVRTGAAAQAIFAIPAVGSIAAAPTLPVKVTLVDAGSGWIGRGLYGGTRNRTISAPPGTYTAFVSRGPEWSVNQVPVTLTAGGEVTLSGADLTLTRVVSTPGFVAGDYHLHTVQSRDSGVTLEERALSLAAEGLEYVALTDHERVGTLAPAIAAQGLEEVLQALVGDEVSIPLYGHFNAYPMPAASMDTREHDGTRFWFDTTLGRRLEAGELIEKLRDIPGDRIVQMNHPRSSGKGYLEAIEFDPETGSGTESLATDFDTIEVNSEIQPEEGKTLLDWFSMLKQGFHVTAVGVSDSHEAWDPGYPRTLVQVGADDPTQVSESVFIAALRTGRATVSSGPFVVTSAFAAAGSAGLGETLDASGTGGSFTLEVHVQSPGWAPYDTIRVYENGNLVATRAVAPALSGGRFASDESFPLSPGVDAFYVVVVTGPGSLDPVQSAGVYGYTNPIYVDRAGDGWSPPGL